MWKATSKECITTKRETLFSAKTYTTTLEAPKTKFDKSDITYMELQQMIQRGADEVGTWVKWNHLPILQKVL